MVKCCVVFCTSGYKNNKENVSKFAAPRDPELRKKWAKAIPRQNFVLTDSTYVCEKHFNESDIIRYWQSGSDPTTIVKIPYKIPKLVKNAVPSIFPGPKYLSKEIKKRKPPTVRQNASNSEKKLKIQNNTEDCQQLNCDLNESTSHISTNNLYDQIHSLATSGTLTSYIPWPETSGICKGFNAETSHCFSSFCSGVSFSIIEKCVSVKIDGTITFGVFGKKIEEQKLNIIPAKNVEEFVKNLQDFEKINVCHGGPLVENFQKHSTALCVADCTGRLRHIDCCLIIEKNLKYCIKCQKLCKSLAMWKKRKENGAQERIFLCPTKRQRLNKLQRDKICLKKKVLRANKKLENLRLELHEVKNGMAKYSDKLIEKELTKIEGMNESQKTLIRECFAASKIKNSRNRRYSENWLLLCLLFSIRSPGAYKYLRESQLLPLPHMKTVRQLLSSLKTTCGFDSEFLTLLGKKVQHMSSVEKHGVLIFDEVNLRQSLQVNTSNLSYIGLEDYGDADISKSHKEYANHALVFMWQSLASNFSQTVGVFATKGEVKGTTLAQLVLKAITLLEKNGILVDGIICDGATTNKKMWKELGVNGTQDKLKHYFEHPLDENRKIYAFSDFVHVFKCVRNRLYNNTSLRLHHDSDSVSWSYFKEVYKNDILHPANLRLIPRITPQHLQLSSMSKMRVRLCTQVFSMSMAQALRFYMKKGCLMLKGASETANFVEYWNNLFDNFNRILPWQGLRIGDEGFEKFYDAINYLNSWENKVIAHHITPEEFLTPQTAQSLRVTLHSTIDLSMYLLEKCGFEYVLTGKMCQDPLEKFFGIIRQAAGPNDHPTTPTFLHLYKILSVYSVLKPPKYGNCTVVNSDSQKISLADIRDIFHEKPSERWEKIEKLKTKLDSLVENNEWEACDVLPIIDSDGESSVQDCIVYYVCGYVTKKILKHKKCSKCIAFLNNGVVTHSAGELVVAKSRGLLVHPNGYLFDFLKSVEHSFAKYCGDLDVFEKVISDITKNINFKFSCSIHLVEVTTELIVYYVQMRMRQYSYQENLKCKKLSREKKKQSKLCNT
ncbi:unnamed protein product [Macrosiphum euphorbiae]|uniref:THAP-type domain-containing protein n=1 Tax=Macrosiphum euphorbiae TaxID=13131 RepID=A0AAV0VJT8_9HEMI|nr:unnamed protein product [Macrosiphum euphorbiae]